ncbi:hypothetical protein DSCW_04410 [Desulfosarcina widdelii]|uniref:Uncharacterized protein n=1 Tax=Desulfosarcina widdelii TaxID=947919 RepID=A0A5K7Z3H7_9BACT|nr:hypothetical protein DSCW_04410 [Desulfosarcina widdelii]
MVEDHCSTADAPKMISPGRTVRSTVGTGRLTVTAAVADVLPPGPVAVRVYVVVVSGEIVNDPFVATEPMFGSIWQVSAWVVAQARMMADPDIMVSGVAEKSTVGSGAADES